MRILFVPISTFDLKVEIHILDNFFARVKYLWISVLKTEIDCALGLNFSTSQENGGSFFAKNLMNHKIWSGEKRWPRHYRSKHLKYA